MRNPNARVPDPRSIVSCSGSKYHVIYESRFNGQSLCLVEVGREEISPKINAYAPYTDLVYMLSRLKVNDFSVLNSRPPMYGDFSGLPANPVDAINLVHSAESAFASLPLDEKQKYNNDYRVWLAGVFSGSGLPAVSAGSASSAGPDLKKTESSNDGGTTE